MLILAWLSLYEAAIVLSALKNHAVSFSLDAAILSI